jgi:hypothetical protein
MTGPSPDEQTASVVICPTCYRVGAGRCVCSPERAYASDAAYSEASWLASLRRAEQAAAVKPAGPRPCPPGYAVHTTTAPVICEYCAEIVGRLDGYRHGYTLDGLHYRCPGVTR